MCMTTTDKATRNPYRKADKAHRIFEMMRTHRMIRADKDFFAAVEKMERDGFVVLSDKRQTWIAASARGGAPSIASSVKVDATDALPGPVA